jgi:hypothetical protein
MKPLFLIISEMVQLRVEQNCWFTSFISLPSATSGRHFRFGPYHIGFRSKTNARAIANDWARRAGHLGTEAPPECCLPDERAGHASTGGFGEADHNQALLCGGSVTNSKITEVPSRVWLRATASTHYERALCFRRYEAGCDAASATAARVTAVGCAAKSASLQKVESGCGAANAALFRASLRYVG